MINLETIPLALETLRQQNEIPGLSVAITFGPEVIFEQALGVADLQTQTPLTPQAVLPIGSITKTFIATLLMHLTEQGLVSLSDPLRCYLPEYPHSATTLRQLAAHTSGLPRDAAVNYPMNYSIGSMAAAGEKAVIEWYASTDELLASLPSVELETAPDSGKTYSNLGICLLGLALERAARQPMAQLLAERIFAPLGMTSSQFVVDHRHLAAPLAQRLASGYVYTDHGPLTAPPWQLGCAAYSGGICCTAGDLARFLAFHLAPPPTNPVLPPASVQRMRPTHSAGDGYLGWWKGWHAGRENFGHAGGHFGYLATALGITNLQLGVVVLTNRFSPARFEDHATEIAKKLLEILAPAVELPPASFDPLAVDLRPYEGTYALAGGYTPVQIQAAPGHLTLSWLDRPYPAETYRPIGPDQFTPQGSPAPIPLLTFTRSEQGTPEKLNHALFTFRRSRSTTPLST
jgi:CubicO group peptidase (beta-lactamase class C family)